MKLVLEKKKGKKEKKVEGIAEQIEHFLWRLEKDNLIWNWKSENGENLGTMEYDKEHMPTHWGHFADMMPISHNIEYVPMDHTHSLTITLVAGSHFPLLRKAHTLLQVDLSVVAFTLTVGSSFLYFFETFSLYSKWSFLLFELETWRLALIPNVMDLTNTLKAPKAPRSLIAI